MPILLPVAPTWRSQSPVVKNVIGTEMVNTLGPSVPYGLPQQNTRHERELTSETKAQTSAFDTVFCSLRIGQIRCLANNATPSNTQFIAGKATPRRIVSKLSCGSNSKAFAIANIQQKVDDNTNQQTNANVKCEMKL